MVYIKRLTDLIQTAKGDYFQFMCHIFRVIDAPIYCTQLTAGLVELKLAEHKLLSKVTINRVRPGDVVSAGVFSVEFIQVNHSIMDSCAFAISTPVGTVVQTGDFKIDTTPIDGKMIDLARFGELGRNGVLLLLSDSTNVERPGLAMSERMVGESFRNIFKDCSKRIIVASFASNIHRIQQIIDAAVENGRKVAVSGRSMENILNLGLELGYLRVQDDCLIDITAIDKYPKKKVCRSEPSAPITAIRLRKERSSTRLRQSVRRCIVERVLDLRLASARRKCSICCVRILSCRMMIRLFRQISHCRTQTVMSLIRGQMYRRHPSRSILKSPISRVPVENS